MYFCVIRINDFFRIMKLDNFNKRKFDNITQELTSFQLKVIKINEERLIQFTKLYSNYQVSIKNHFRKSRTWRIEDSHVILLACQLPLHLRLFSDSAATNLPRHKQLYNQITHSPELTVLVSASTDSVFCFFGRSSLSSFEASVRLLGVELALAFSSIGLPASGPEP